MHHSICPYFTYGLPTPIPDEPTLKSTLQHTATRRTSSHSRAHCNTLQQHTATRRTSSRSRAHFNTLQHTGQARIQEHTATHCNKHTATHRTSSRSRAHCNTLQQHIATHRTSSRSRAIRCFSAVPMSGDTLLMNGSCHVCE